LIRTTTGAAAATTTTANNNNKQQQVITVLNFTLCTGRSVGLFVRHYTAYRLQLDFL
jgi:hypothetical protein